MKKFLPYIFIAIVLVGLFGIVSSVRAQTDPYGTCLEITQGGGVKGPAFFGVQEANCRIEYGDTYKWWGPGQVSDPIAEAKNALLLATTDAEKAAAEAKLKAATATTGNPAGTPTSDTNGDGVIDSKDAAPAGTGEADKDPSKIFGVCFGSGNSWYFSVPGCITQAGYYILIVIPSNILYITAHLFNTMLALTLGTVLYKNNFLPEAWRIIRDFSNIFFILVLLYISIKMILGLGVAEMKKMIVNVIIAALLINFSMFMTQVVIDSSNVLALIFYNKINVSTEGSYTPVILADKNDVEDKDIALGIATAFNPSKFVNAGIANKLNVQLEKTGESFTDCVNNTSTVVKFVAGPLTPAKCFLSLSGNEGQLPFVAALAIEVTAAGVFLFAAWAFFVAGLAFIGRLIELWILIIFSPFAFMSFSVPKLKGLDFLGWDAWIKRLVSVSFMAPIFMFFLLLISKLVQIDILKGVINTGGDTTVFRTLFIMTIPAIIYLTMLIKATEYAKKHAGEFGEAVIKYGKMAGAAVGGVALGVASGGAGLAASATLGRAGAAAANSGWAKKWESKGFGGGAFRKVASSIGSSSFDLRKAPGIGSALKAAGIKTESSAIAKSLGLSTEGGWTQRRKDTVEKRQKRAKELEVGEDEKLKQKLNGSEQDLQEMLNKVTKDFEVIDKVLEDARQAKADARVGSPEELAAITRINHFKALKKNIREGGAFTAEDGTHYAGGLRVNGNTIKDFQADIIPGQKNDILTETRRRKTNYARSLTKNATRRTIRGLEFLAAGTTLGIPGLIGVGAHAVQHNSKAEREAAHAIIMEVKLPESTGK